MSTTETAYPNREHRNADNAARRRAESALDEIENEVRIIRRRVDNGLADGDDASTLADRVRALTRNLAILEALRDVREWHAADIAKKCAACGETREHRYHSTASLANGGHIFALTTAGSPS